LRERLSSTPQREERIVAMRTPTEFGRMPDLLPVQHSGHGDDAIRAHNTLSAENTHVQVYYPFHPLRGAILQVVRRPKRGDGAVSVIDPIGKRLKIPVWMLSPECAPTRITEEPHLSKEALLHLTSLLATRLPTADQIHDNLLQTVVDEHNGGQRGATTTSGPDDPNGHRRRVHRRTGARGSNRSNGPHSTSGL
jgi:hypothetical protein